MLVSCDFSITQHFITSAQLELELANTGHKWKSAPLRSTSNLRHPHSSYGRPEKRYVYLNLAP